MQVTLSFRDQITTEMEVQSVSWASAESQQIGRATLRIPHNHPAFNPDYISEDKGSTIRIFDETLGTWRGVVVRTRFIDDGAAVILTCHDLRSLFNGLPVGRQHFRLASAGTIVRAAFRQAVGGRSRIGLTEGIFVENAPLISHEFDRDSFRDILNVMQEQTAQEWMIDDDGVFHWVARQGSINETPLVQGHDFHSVEWETGAIDRVSEIIAIDDDGQEMRFMAPEMADGGFWVARTIASGDDDSGDLESRALRMLEEQRHPHPTVDATIARHLWGEIREGDIRRMVIPSAGFSGDSVTVRFQTREWSSSDGQLDVTMDVLPELIDEAIV